MRRFIGIIFKGLDEGFVATFPDVLECVEFGETPEEARAVAAATLPALLRDLEVHSGRPIRASTFEEIIGDPQNEGCQAFEAVTLAFNPSRSKHLNAAAA
jgi:predicted RNase H-like HicB family nuclease